MSSYKGLNLFGSGPHRVRVGKRGHLVTLDFFTGGTGAGSTSQGLFDLDVIVTGRLVATTEAALWALRDAVTNQLAFPPVPGTLIDNTGRSYADLTLVSYVEEEPRDLGRVFSIGYEAQFRRLP